MKPLPVSVFRSVSDQNSASATIFYRLAAFVALCAILYFGKDVLIPVAIAVILAVLLSPLTRGLQRIGLPKGVAVLSVVIFAVLAASGAGYLVGRTLTGLAADLPVYEANLREKARTLKVFASNGDALEKAAGVIEGLKVELSKDDTSPVTTQGKPIPVEIQDTHLGPFAPVVTVMAMVIHPLVQFGIVVLMLTFILFNREDLRDRLIRLAGTNDIHRTTVALDEAGSRLSRMFIGQLAINGGVGTVLGLALFLLGVPGAFLWGLLTTILRFVPFVGTLMASVFPIVIALAVGDGWALPLAVAALVIAAEVTAGHVLEPIFLGKMTGVSSTAIVAAAAFWAMIWGPVGLILATPITIGLLVIGRNIESMSFLDVLFGSEPVLSADHALYQRLLAGDHVEAAEAAAPYQAEGRLTNYLEEVAIPALTMASGDLQRGVLSKEKATAVATTFSDTLDDVWSDEADFERAAAPVLVIANHGPLNFAAAVAFSALLQLKRVPHRMLPQDAISPGKFPEIDEDKLAFACLVSLTAPTAAQLHYIERRVLPRIGTGRLLNVAWSLRGDNSDAILATRAVSLLPQEKTEDAGEVLSSEAA